MAEKTTLEERFSQLESRVAELEQQRHIQEDRDIALLARIDGFIEDLHRVERVQMRSFEELTRGQQEAKAQIQKLETSVEGIVDTLQNHKEAIESHTVAIEKVGGQVGALATRFDHLEAGQQQIIALLTRRSPLHD